MCPVAHALQDYRHNQGHHGQTDAGPEQPPDLKNDGDPADDKRDQTNDRTDPSRESAAVVYVLAAPVGRTGHM